MRELWTGDTVDHWGEHYTVEKSPALPKPAQAGGRHFAVRGADAVLIDDVEQDDIAYIRVTTFNEQTTEGLKREIGLLSERIRPHYERAGLAQYFGGLSADVLSEADVLTSSDATTTAGAPGPGRSASRTRPAGRRTTSAGRPRARPPGR